MDTQVAQVNALLAQHNPGLVKPEESPGANTIYKIWDDGEITYEKGGWAYGDRNAFSAADSIFTTTFEKFGVVFPETLSKPGRTMYYAIVTKEQAYQIRWALTAIRKAYLASPYQWDSANHRFSTERKSERDLKNDLASLEWLETIVARDPHFPVPLTRVPATLSVPAAENPSPST